MTSSRRPVAIADIQRMGGVEPLMMQSNSLAMSTENLIRRPRNNIDPRTTQRRAWSFRQRLRWGVLFPILSIIHRLQAIVVRSMRKWGWRKVRRSSALGVEVTPTSIDNLGDQAMLGGLVAVLQHMGVRDIGIVTFKAQNPWSFIDGTHHAFAMDGLLNQLLLVWRLSSYERIYYPGADVMDGAYSDTMVRRITHLLAVADALGLEATVCGFSFNKDPDRQALRHVSDLPPSIRLCCRDVPSHRRLQQYLHRDVELVADVAFNLPPDGSSDIVRRVAEWIDQQRDSGRQIVGVNLHDQLARFESGVAADELWQRIAEILRELAGARNVAYVLIPHVYRPGGSDLNVLRDFRAILAPELRETTMLVEERCSARQMKAISGHCDLVLSGRMHLAIASLGQGVPVICITYQDKFEGLMEHFGLTGNTFSPGAVLRGDELTARMLDYLEQTSELKQRVLESLPRIVEMSRANVK